MQTVQQFKDQGYETELFYIGLPSIEQATSRFELRVSRGGHGVSGENISTNYTEGLISTQQHIHQFDRSIILDNQVRNETSIPYGLAEYEKGKIVKQVKDLQKWAEKIVGKKKAVVRKQRLGRRRGRRL